MKSVVVFKWSKNPQDARVSADGIVSWKGVKLSATDDDPAALDIAKTLSAEDDIIGVTIGDGKPEWAAARGAASTIVAEDAFGSVDGSEAAEAIAAIVRHVGLADVVTIGDSDWDGAVVVSLVGKLGIRAYAGVIAAELVGDAIRITVKSDGVQRVVETHPPVLLACKALGSEENAPGMKQTLAARKKPLIKLTRDDLGLSGKIRVQSKGTRLPEGNACVMMDGVDPAAVAAELVAALRGEGVL